MPAVSVILPTHDRGHLVTRAARSVLDQDVADLELLVVDDASAVPAAESLAALDDPRLRVLRAGDAALGPARARNLGLEAARGAWIAFQDDDDEWLPGKLSAQLDAAAADPAPGAVYSPFLRVAADGRRLPGPSPRGGGDLREALLRGNFIGLPTLMARRDVLASTGGFDEGLPCFEDWELCIRLATATSFALVERPLALAHDSPGSVNKAPSGRQAAAYRTILERHRDAILARPDVHAEFLFHVGHHLALAGELATARRELRRAATLRPTPARLAAWAASWLGAGGYRAACRAAGRV